jgi:hypothetical protein
MREELKIENSPNDEQ